MSDAELLPEENSPLGDRMKRYEHTTRLLAPPRCYSLLRVDIRAAHSYLRRATRPFDFRFMETMDRVAEALCIEITGAVCAYTQSDEISVLFHDFAAPNTQPWFGGVMAKQISISAGLASATLMSLRPGRLAMFDARVWHMSDPVEVANYFVWRQRDAIRNSIQMVAQHVFGHAELQGLNTDQLQEKLWQEKGINWSKYPDQCKRGRLTMRYQGLDGHESFWGTEAAPDFKAEPGTHLAKLIPPLPVLTIW